MGKVSQHYMEEIASKYEREELLRGLGYLPPCPMDTEENEDD
ncbi:hypothetical protein [Candidatus Liberibacter sp.]|nr:hypothetical protein [Candidatus Liberibacter sp.]